MVPNLRLGSASALPELLEANPYVTITAFSVALAHEMLLSQMMTQHTLTRVQPVSGGQPVSGQPVSGQPVSGQPVSGQPVSGQPVSGQPVTGHEMLRSQMMTQHTPTRAQPVSGQPVGGQPVITHSLSRAAASVANNGGTTVIRRPGRECPDLSSVARTHRQRYDETRVRPPPHT